MTCPYALVASGKPFTLSVRAAVHAAEKVCGAQKPSAASDKKLAALERTVADLSAALKAVASRPLDRTDPGTPTRHAPAHPSHCPSSINLFTLFTSTSTQRARGWT